MQNEIKIWYIWIIFNFVVAVVELIYKNRDLKFVLSLSLNESLQDLWASNLKYEALFKMNFYPRAVKQYEYGK